MLTPNEINIDELLSRIDLRLDKSSIKIRHTDSDGNEFRFLSNGKQTILDRAIVKTATVNLPACVIDEVGGRYLVTSVGEHSFSSQQELKYLTIPEGVVALEDGIFSNCGSLLGVVIPSSVKKLGEVFWRCPTFEENAGGLIYYTGTQKQWKVLMNSEPDRGMMDYTPYDQVVRFIPRDTAFELPKLDFQTTYDKGLKMKVSRIRICELGGEITIPETHIDSKGIVRKIIHIGRSSFAGNNQIERVIIPSSIQRICQDAFYHCTNLREVVILPGDGELDIEMGAFFNCEHLEKVYVGRPCWWGERALEKTNAQRIEIN